MVSGNGWNYLSIAISPCIKDLIRYCWTVNSVQRVALVFLHAGTICAGRFRAINNVSCQAIDRLKKGLIL